MTPTSTTGSRPANTTSPMACATGRPSATPSSSPTGFTPFRPRRCSPLRRSTISTRLTTIHPKTIIRSPPLGIRVRSMWADRPMFMPMLVRTTSPQAFIRSTREKRTSSARWSTTAAHQRSQTPQAMRAPRWSSSTFQTTYAWADPLPARGASLGSFSGFCWSIHRDRS